MERLLVYLAVVAAVAAALSSASRLKPQPDYCAEARRFASDVLAVYQSRGRVVGEYNLDGVSVAPSGLSHPTCGVNLQVPTANSTTLSARVRLEIAYEGGRVAFKLRE